VDYATSDGTAKSGVDYLGVTNTLSFAAGETVKLFSIAILNDALKEPNKGFHVTLSNPTGGGVLGKRLRRQLREDKRMSYPGANGFSLNTTNRIHSRTQTITGTWTQTWSPTLVMELNANYSRSRVSSSYTLDDFGGAVIPDQLPSSSFVFDLNSRHAVFMRGDEAASLQRQFNVVGFANGIIGTHDWKFGGDYRPRPWYGQGFLGAELTWAAEAGGYWDSNYGQNYYARFEPRTTCN
jgi:hypothetical protein